MLVSSDFLLCSFGVLYPSFKVFGLPVLRYPSVLATDSRAHDRIDLMTVYAMPRCQLP